MGPVNRVLGGRAQSSLMRDRQIIFTVALLSIVMKTGVWS